MEKYINALGGISYPEWIKLRTGIDREFEHQKSESEKKLKLAGSEKIKQSISEKDLSTLREISENQIRELFHQLHKSDTAAKPELSSLQ